eukprot:1160146-Pelagomonas_calceolata.AAC.24
MNRPEEALSTTNCSLPTVLSYAHIIFIHTHACCSRPIYEQAKDALATIDGRLSGTLLGVSSAPSLPLSVEGHVQRLVAEATDKDNLSRMYIWWMPCV